MSGYQPRSRRLEELSWPEVREALAQGYTTVVVAAGSIEQHGPHLPLVTDTAIGAGLIEAVVGRLDGALQGPTIPFGCSEHHMAFPGTITLEADTFKRVVREYILSLARHGVEVVYLIPSHGGNFAPLREAVAELGAAAGATQAIAYTDLTGFMEAIYASQAPYGVTPAVAGAHAGNTETALMLALAPALVRMEHAAAGYVGDFGAETQQIVFTQGMPALTANGILGDARGADAARGHACLEALADHLARYLQQRLGAQARTGETGR